MARGNGTSVSATLAPRRQGKKAKQRFEVCAGTGIGHGSQGQVRDTVHDVVLGSNETYNTWVDDLNQQAASGLPYVRITKPDSRDVWYDRGIYCLVCGSLVTWYGRRLKASDYATQRCTHMPASLSRYSKAEQDAFDQRLLGVLGGWYRRAEQIAANGGPTRDAGRFSVERLASALHATQQRTIGRLEALERQGLITEGGWRDLVFGYAVRHLTQAGIDAATAAYDGQAA